MNLGELDLIEDPDQIFAQTYQAVEELVREGLIRNIGCKNIDMPALQNILNHAQIKPSVIQIEQQALFDQQELKCMAQEQGI